jgi:hypothetical protein
MKSLVSMRTAASDPDLLGKVLGGASRLAWRSILTASLGEELLDDERDAFQRLTGRAREPLERVSEIWAIVGRRGGKSSAIAALAVYLSCCCDHSPNLSVGERGVCLVLASNTKQAGVVFGYIAGLIEAVPTLAALVQNKTSEVISLSNGIDIEVRAAGFRGLRGVTAICVIADEISYWIADEYSRNPDKEILDAVRPALATTGGMLVAIGSPHAQRGEMWRAFKRDYGPQGDPQILVLRGASRDLNPLLPQAIVDRALERDAASARAEFLGEFRSDLESYVTTEAVEAVTIPGRIELAPVPGIKYFGAVDAAGGSGGDSMTAGIAHLRDNIAVLDAVREVKPPFAPDDTVTDFCSLFQIYGVTEITGDRWGSEFVRERFTTKGVAYRIADRTKSDYYKELLPLLNSRRIELLSVPKLQAQLLGLERRTARGGRDSIDHAQNSHDDIVNSAAIALVTAASRNVEPGWIAFAREQLTGVSHAVVISGEHLIKLRVPPNISHIQTMSGVHLGVPNDRIIEVSEDDAAPLIAQLKFERVSIQ